MADRIVIWRFGEVTRGLSRAEAEFLRDCLVAQRRDDSFQLGVRMRMALNGQGPALPLELSVFDVPALRSVLDGVRVGGSPGLAVLQDEVGAAPHPEDAPRRPKAPAPEAHGSGSEDGGEDLDDPVVVWRFKGDTQALNRREAATLRDWLLAVPNLAWIALGGRLREALANAEGAAPVELTLADVPVLQGVLDAAPIDEGSGLALLQQEAGAVW